MNLDIVGRYKLFEMFMFKLPVLIKYNNGLIYSWIEFLPKSINWVMEKNILKGIGVEKQEELWRYNFLVDFNFLFKKKIIAGQ